MPYKKSDYSKSQIYKIVCKDTNIKNFYIGSTTNWNNRKCGHKSICNNINDKKYNLLIYKIIRDNGGFDNWDMILIENYICENKRELEKREQYWKEELKPDMNISNPFTYENTNLNTKEFNKEHYQKNKEYAKNYYKKILEENPDYNKKKYLCECCNKEFSLRNKSNHIKSLKHINNTN